MEIGRYWKKLVSIVFVGLRKWYEPDEIVGAMQALLKSMLLGILVCDPAKKCKLCGTKSELTAIVLMKVLLI